MKKWQFVVIIAVVAVLAAGAGAYAATTYGTQADPLVTVSYLTDTLEPTLRGDFESQLSSAMENLEYSFEADIAGATGTFEVVSLPSGKTLSCSAGCEILYRSGGASAVGTLVDISAGNAAASGASLTENHLYMASESGSGVKASGTVTLLVRGTYTMA